MTTGRDSAGRDSAGRDRAGRDRARRGIAELVAEASSRLTPAERRIAEAVVADPKVVAFGTVAELASRTGSSGPTVLRFAAKLGFAGFVDLQAAVQEEIADQLRPATERIRERSFGNVLERTLAADLDNVRLTFEGIDADAFRDAVALICDRRRRVFVAASEVGAAGPALATQFDLLRDRVVALGGSPVSVSRSLIQVEPGDVIVAIDVRRYERWLVEAAQRAVARGAMLIAITDTLFSPLATDARYTFIASARGVGPFDSPVGIVALVHAIGAAAAARLRRGAVERLDAVEASWRDGHDLIDG